MGTLSHTVIPRRHGARVRVWHVACVHSSAYEEVTPMRRFMLTAFLAVALVSPAQADVWEISWTSDVRGIRFFSVTPGVSDSSTSSHVTGFSLATVSPGANGSVAIGFSTAAGLAALTAA